MQISWFEIIAQIINFFIMLFILQKLLYKPVINAMETRQERISKSQIEADREMAKARELINEYNARIADIDEEKRDLLEKARISAEERRDELLSNYKKEAEAKRNIYLKEIEDEKDGFLERLSKELGENAVKIASHILSTISSKELDEEVFNSFIKEISNLEKKTQDNKILNDQINLKLYSARDISKNEKIEIEKVLNDQINNLENISYELDENLILGFELHMDTHSIHTSIKNYLDIIEDDIINTLEKK